MKEYTFLISHIQFQVSYCLLVAIVSWGFILYYRVMIFNKGNLRFCVKMLAILNIESLTGKLSPKTFYLSFLKLFNYFYMNCIPLDFRSQSKLHLINFSPLEFKMSNTGITERQFCNSISQICGPILVHNLYCVTFQVPRDTIAINCLTSWI